jgi:hypothetical protein
VPDRDQVRDKPCRTIAQQAGAVYGTVAGSRALSEQALTCIFQRPERASARPPYPPRTKIDNMTHTVEIRLPEEPLFSLRQAGLWLSEDLVATVLMQAGERGA